MRRQRFCGVVDRDRSATHDQHLVALLKQELRFAFHGLLDDAIAKGSVVDQLAEQRLKAGGIGRRPRTVGSGHLALPQCPGSADLRALGHDLWRFGRRRRAL